MFSGWQGCFLTIISFDLFNSKNGQQNFIHLILKFAKIRTLCFPASICSKLRAYFISHRTTYILLYLLFSFVQSNHRWQEELLKHLESFQHSFRYIYAAQSTTNTFFFFFYVEPITTGLFFFFFIYQLKKNYNYYKNTATLTVTFMARKDTRSPGPHHECHLHFNYKLIQREQKLSRKKRRGCCCYISTLI